ncbi:MAG: hypothetical protein WCP28_15300 [Actinomycetes bacterium]
MPAWLGITATSGAPFTVGTSAGQSGGTGMPAGAADADTVALGAAGVVEGF